MDEPLRITCEVLIIGSGPGGASTAALLAEAGRDVVLIEEGGNYSIDSAPNYTLDEMDQKYRQAGLTPAFGKTRVTYIEGRCVGGASEINAALYHRPLPETLLGWAAQYQVDQMSAADLEPYFDRIEREIGVVTLRDGEGPASERLKLGADRLGWKSSEIARFWSYPPGAPREGRRRSMSETMVPRALRAGARLFANTQIRHLETVAGGATVAVGTTQAEDGRRRPVRIAFADVFVCGGAVQTPALLRRSGLTHNIGDALRMHPMIRIAARFADKVNDPAFGVPVRQVEQFKPHMTLGCSHSSLPHLALWLNGDVPGKKEILQNIDNVAIFYVAVPGSGAGSVRNLPLFDQPFVRYPLTDQDLALLGEGLYRLGQLAFEAGAVELFNPLPGGKPIRSPGDLAGLRTGLPQGKINVTTIHLFSSCPMGEDTRRCAVDSFGKLHSARNIYVNDASILPNTPGVNPQGTILAIAQRNADRYLGRL